MMLFAPCLLSPVHRRASEKKDAEKANAFPARTMAHPPGTFGDLQVDSAWHVWHPSDPPIPHKHPLNESIASCFDDNL